MLATYVVALGLLSITGHGQLTRDEYYSNWMGTMADNAGSTAFDGDITSLRIIDIVMPGSHQAGMYPAAIVDNNYLTSTDDYYSNVVFYTEANNARRMQWAKRQRGDIESQLKAGSRFLDIRLETKGGATYAHNGLLGAQIDTMLADIKSFLDASDKKDIIILSFSGFINVDANALFSLVQSTLTTDYIQPRASYDIHSDTIAQLLTKKVHVIPFFDDMGSTSNLAVWDAAALLHGAEPVTTFGTVAISEVVGSILEGWDTSATASAQMHLIYYVLNIDAFSDYTKYSNLYPSFAEYASADLMMTLSATIRKYPKLYFGNVVIVDFVQASSVVDEVISLNYNYFSCRDPPLNWGQNGDDTDCPEATVLSQQYKSADEAQACVNSIPLRSYCPRSCGRCSWIGGVPGSACDASTPCDGGIYAATGTTGECFEREDDWESFIKEPTFCLAPFKSSDCGSKSTDSCAAESGVGAGCTSFCSSDYQCASGYCDSSTTACLEIGEEVPTTTTDEAKECYCPHVISETAIEWRESIAGYRPGDPDAPYEFSFEGGVTNPTELQSTLDANPYVKSLIGFIMIPFVLAILMFVSYAFCCPCWCICTKCCKKCCCKCCLRDTDESPAGRWIPTVCMLTILIVLVWAAMEGVTANEKMHDHIFADDTDSLRTEMIGLFDVVIDKFEGVGPQAGFIVANIKKIFGSITGILAKVDSGIGDNIIAIYTALNNIVTNYDGFSIVTNITSPFVDPTTGDIVTETVVLPCDYCQGLGDQIGGINDTFKAAVSIVGTLQDMLNGSDALVGAEEVIDSAVGEFNTLIANFTAQIDGYRTQTNDSLNSFEAIDEQREQALSAFLLLPVVWLVFWIIGVIMAAIPFCKENGCLKFIGECCFKLTWCNAMWIGGVVMLVFSFFAIISVGWADLCYNLDEFEADPDGSNLGKTIAAFTNGTAMDPVDIVNACWTGSDLMQTLNLTDKIDFTSFRENMTSALEIDITKELTLDALDSFVAEINLLNTDEFKVEGDRLIGALNAVGNKCTCDCSPHGVAPGAIFTRTKISDGSCHNSTGQSPRGCWFDPVLAFADSATATLQFENCVANFTAAHVYLQAEVKLTNETQTAINYIKLQTSSILQAYDGIFGVAVDIENSVQNISCSIDPIFEKFDALLRDYSTCGFIGESYGGFKNVGCVLLFGDMYYISKSMMIIAFVSILAVLFGFMSQYSWHPVKDDEDDENDTGAKLMKSVSSRFGIGGTSHDADGVEKELELAEQTQPAPPSDPPPAFEDSADNNVPEGGGAPVNFATTDTTIPVEVNETETGMAASAPMEADTAPSAPTGVEDEDAGSGSTSSASGDDAPGDDNPESDVL